MAGVIKVEHLVWLDTETSGPNPNSDTLLEVAAIITDMDLNVISAQPFERTIYFSEEDTNRLFASTSPYVQDMHNKTGLWGRLKDGTPHRQVEDELLAFIKEHTTGGRTSVLAGNSVGFDKGFLEAQMKKVSSYLSYRVIDVSSFAMWHHAKTGEVFQKQYAHSALSDIEESIAEFRWLTSK